jgi:hypothetical protein
MKKIPWFVLLTFLLIACGPGVGSRVIVDEMRKAGYEFIVLK